MMRRVLAVIFMLVFSWGAGPAQHFAIATAPYAYRFPRDHFAHDAYRTEWWYFTGHVRAPDGRRFGYELTFFRIGLEPHPSRWARSESRWRAAQLYPAHFAISDEREHRFVYDETFARDALGQGDASERALSVHANGWSLTGSNATMPRMHLSARSGSDALSFTVIPQKPPAIHGNGGISRKGPCASCASHYYSFTRLKTTGTLVRDGTPFRVDGISWMDHEFGSNELGTDETGWDWFSLQLGDGRDVMLYRIRTRDATARQSSGSTIGRGGGVTGLSLADFSIAATSWWKSPHTGALYPSGWRVRIRGISEPLVLTPVFSDQELVDATGTTYWEGAVDVRNAAGRSLGEGYVELTGYAGSVRI